MVSYITYNKNFMKRQTNQMLLSSIDHAGRLQNTSFDYIPSKSPDDYLIFLFFLIQSEFTDKYVFV